jgi:hypothetical protein
LRDVLQTPVSELSKMGASGRDAVLQKHNATTEAKKLADLLKLSCENRQRII